PTRGDPTGAGDMFGGAFLIEYLRTEDPVLSAYLASAATSFAIGRSMLSGWIN
ncbi:MAG: PfkB family carbohydrate kinase, partial [Nitrososphaerales archaeon]